MFSVFTDADVPRRTVINNENNVVARKATLSARKPLTDRKVNLTQETTPSIKSKLTPRPPRKETSVNEDTPIDFCSYKEVADNYEDLSLPDQLLSKDTINNIIAEFSRAAEPEPPELLVEPPKCIAKSFQVHDCELLDADRIAELLKSELGLLNELDVIPVPDLL